MELAGIAQQSMGVVSRRTLLSGHPWVVDVEKELAQIAAEEQEAREQVDQYGDAFQKTGKEEGEEREKDGDGVKENAE